MAERGWEVVDDWGVEPDDHIVESAKNAPVDPRHFSLNKDPYYSGYDTVRDEDKRTKWSDVGQALKIGAINTAEAPAIISDYMTSGAIGSDARREAELTKRDILNAMTPQGRRAATAPFLGDKAHEGALDVGLGDYLSMGVAQNAAPMIASIVPAWMATGIAARAGLGIAAQGAIGAGVARGSSAAQNMADVTSSIFDEVDSISDDKFKTIPRVKQFLDEGMSLDEARGRYRTEVAQHYPLIAAVVGAVSAFPEAEAAKTLAGASGKKGLLKGAIGQIGGGAAEEFGEEGSGAALSELAGSKAGLSDIDYHNIISSALGGAAQGGVLHAPTALVHLGADAIAPEQKVALSSQTSTEQTTPPPPPAVEPEKTITSPKDAINAVNTAEIPADIAAAIQNATQSKPANPSTPASDLFDETMSAQLPPNIADSVPTQRAPVEDDADAWETFDNWGAENTPDIIRYDDGRTEEVMPAPLREPDLPRPYKPGRSTGWMTPATEQALRRREDALATPVNEEPSEQEYWDAYDEYKNEQATPQETEAPVTSEVTPTKNPVSLRDNIIKLGNLTLQLYPTHVGYVVKGGPELTINKDGGFNPGRKGEIFAKDAATNGVPQEIADTIKTYLDNPNEETTQNIISTLETLGQSKPAAQTAKPSDGVTGETAPVAGAKGRRARRTAEQIAADNEAKTAAKAEKAAAKEAAKAEKAKLALETAQKRAAEKAARKAAKSTAANVQPATELTKVEPAAAPEPKEQTPVPSGVLGPVYTGVATKLATKTRVSAEGSHEAKATQAARKAYAKKAEEAFYAHPPGEDEVYEGPEQIDLLRPKDSLTGTRFVRSVKQRKAIRARIEKFVRDIEGAGHEIPTYVTKNSTNHQVYARVAKDLLKYLDGKSEAAQEAIDSFITDEQAARSGDFEPMRKRRLEEGDLKSRPNNELNEETNSGATASIGAQAFPAPDEIDDAIAEQRKTDMMNAAREIIRRQMDQTATADTAGSVDLGSLYLELAKDYPEEIRELQPRALEDIKKALTDASIEKNVKPEKTGGAIKPKKKETPAPVVKKEVSKEENDRLVALMNSLEANKNQPKVYTPSRDSAELLQEKSQVSYALNIIDQTKVPATASLHAQNVGGKVVWFDGNLSLIRGFSRLGQPVYVAAKGNHRTNVDIKSYTGPLLTPVEKEQLLNAQQAFLAEEAKDLDNNPDGPFVGGARFASSPNIPPNIVNYTKSLLNMLGIDARVYLNTNKAALYGEQFSGPYSAFNEGPQNGVAGWTRMIANGDHIIQLAGFDDVILGLNLDDLPRVLETIAHEVGHILEKEAYKKAPSRVQSAIKDEYNKWLRDSSALTVQEHVHHLRPYHAARAVNIDESVKNSNSSQLPGYWRSFDEWFADQVSRWAMSSEKPLSLVDKFFSSIGQQLRRLYASLTGQKYLPSSQMAEWLNSRGPAQIAKDNMVQNDLFDQRVSNSLSSITQEDVTSAVKDQSNATLNKIKRFGIKAATLDQLRQSTAGLFVDKNGNDMMEKLVSTVQRMAPFAQKLRDRSDQLAQQFLELKKSDPDMADRFADLALEATTANVRLGPNADNSHLGKGGRNAQGRGRLTELQREYNSLSPAAKKLYAEMAAYYRTMQNEHARGIVENRLQQYGVNPRDRQGFIDRVINGKTEKSDENLFKDKGKAFDRIKEISQLRVIQGDYFPMMRYGKFIVNTKNKINDLMGGTEIEPGKVEFRASTEKAARALAEAFAENVDLPQTNFQRSPTSQANDFGFIVSVQRGGAHFFENEAEAMKWRRENAKNFDEISEVSPIRETGKGSSDLTTGQLNSLMATVKNSNYSDEEKEVMLDMLKQGSAVLMSGNRIQKRGIARRKVMGASNDFGRNVLQYGEAASSRLAQLKFRPAIDEALNEMREVNKNLMDKEAPKRTAVMNEVSARIDEGVTNVNEPGKFIKDLMALTFLGKLASPMYSVVNAMQPWMVTLPVLSGRFGAVRAASMLQQAYSSLGFSENVMAGLANTYRAGKNFNATAFDTTDTVASIKKNLAKDKDGAELNTLIDELLERGAMSSGGFELAQSISQGRGIWGTKLAQVDRIARQLPQAIEDINRAATAVAAYRLARSSMTEEKARAFAFDTVMNTQGDYSGANAPRVFNNPYLRPALQFKKYAQMMGYLLADMSHRAFAAADVETRREARKQLTALMGVQIAMAGALSLPGIEIAKIGFMVAGALGLGGGWDDQEEKLRKLADDTFGKTWGELITRGVVSRALNIDLSQRLSLADMATFGEPGDYERDGVDAYLWRTFMGAPYSTINDIRLGVQDAVNGDFGKASERIIPVKVIADAFKAANKYSEGKVTPVEAAMNVFGVKSGRQAEENRRIGSNIRNSEAIAAKHKELTNKYLAAKTAGERIKVRAQIVEFNKTAPLRQKVFPNSLEKVRHRQEMERVS